MVWMRLCSSIRTDYDIGLNMSACVLQQFPDVLSNVTANAIIVTAVGDGR